MKLIKKISFFILFTAATAPLFLSAVFLTVRIAIQHDMKEKMEKENAITIEIPESDFRWHKKNREIIVNGKMFDVKSLVKIEHIYRVSGLFDEQESILNEELKKMNEEKDGRQKNANLILQVCLGIIAEDRSGFQCQLSPPKNINVLISGVYYDYHSTYCLNIISPPPEA